jgi:hypothetical protein
MAWMPYNRRRRVEMGAGHTARHGRATLHYRVLYERGHFPAGHGRVLPHEVNFGIGHIHNNEQEH